MKINAITLIDSELLGFLVDAISGDKDNVIFYDLYDPKRAFPQNGVDMNDIDLVIIDFSLFAGIGERNILSAIYAEKSKGANGFPPDYFFIYNDDNAAELVRINDLLLDKKIPMCCVCLDDKSDRVLLIQSVKSTIRRLVREKTSISDLDTEMKEFVFGR